ncbi:RICIN domain-containing protein [Paenibacillus macerans]|uniref:RICIN domain-containing protein n=1 Tax=Paenibacillus macerans TaxID=44252 RepID=UPI003D314E62
MNSGNGQMFDDSEAALVHAIIWKVSSNATEANNSKLKAEEILNAWSGTVNTVVGGDEKQLLAGLTGYRFAAAADILSSDSAWVNAGKLTSVKNMLANYFYPALRDYLDTHYGKNPSSYPYYYRGNQDTAAMVTIMAIGILTNDLSMYNEAVNEFKNGNHNGRVTNYLKPTSDPNLAQAEESGRDQAHTMLGIGMLATMAQMSYYQHEGDASFEDLYEYSNRIILKGFEYTAKYNNGDNNVPFTPVYTFSWRNEPVIGSGNRGETRPIYEMVWNHYHNVKGLADATPSDPVYYSKARAALLRPEGIHTDHQPFTTLLYNSGPVKLRNVTTGLYIDGMGRTTNGSNAGQWSNGSSTNQQWIEEADGNYLRFKNVATGLYLDGMGRTENGSIVGQWEDSTSTNQQWSIVKTGNNVRFQNRATGLYLDGVGRTTNGSDLGQYSSGTSTNQQWQIAN